MTTPKPYTLAELKELEADIQKRPHRWSHEEVRLMHTVKQITNHVAVIVRALDQVGKVRDPAIAQQLFAEQQQAILIVRNMLGV